MSKHLDSVKMAALIQTAAEEIIARTEAFIQSVGAKTLNGEKVPVMINGVSMKLNRKDYAVLKAKNGAVRKDMKVKIKRLTEEFKEDINKESKRVRSIAISNESETDQKPEPEA